MKTNVVMLRSMGSFKVSQRTKDGMFNATELLKQWNKSTGSKKEVKKFFENETTKQFIKTLKQDNEFLKGQYSAYLKTRGKYGGTWMHPYLFIDFAMWINPKFKLEVIKFVHDQLIKNRHEAGDNYKILSNSGSKLKGYDYVTVAKALQWIVFGKTGKNLRQQATQEQLKELKDIQLNLSYAIDMGFINTFDELINQMKKLYTLKNKRLEKNLV